MSGWMFGIILSNIWGTLHGNVPCESWKLYGNSTGTLRELYGNCTGLAM